MKFETLKRNVASFVYNKDNKIDWGGVAIMVNLESMIKEGKRTRTAELIKNLKDKVWDEIMKVDIRCIKTLIDIAPAAVPSWIKAGNYSPELTDEGWELMPLETN